jgi:iron complex transport system substrate-binding protein
VCALPSDAVDDALDYLGCQADVLSLDPHSLDDVLDTILTIGARTGVPERAQALVTQLRARLDEVARATAGRPRSRVAVIEWVDPPFTAGHWVPDLIAAAGGDAVGGRPNQRSVESTWVAVAPSDPDVIIVAPCGFGLDAACRQAETAAAALPGVPVWAIDADALVVRPGPRLVAGVEAIAWMLHPDAVPQPPEGRIARVR